MIATHLFQDVHGLLEDVAAAALAAVAERTHDETQSGAGGARVRM